MKAEVAKSLTSAPPANPPRHRSFRLHRNSKAQFSKRFTRSRAGNFFYFLFLTLAGLFCLLPLIYSVVTSLKPLDEIMVFPPRFFVMRPTLANYTALSGLLSGLLVPIDRYIFNSVFISVSTTFIYVVVSSMAAFSLSKGKYGGRGLLFTVVQFALLFNSFTLALPQYFIMSKLHMIDTYWVYILPQMASTLGIFLMKQYIDGYVPETYLEAAKIDGASYFRIYWKIVLPIIRPAMFTLTLLAFREIWAFTPISTVYSEQIKTLPMVMSQITAGGVARTGSAMALTVIMMVPPICVYILCQSRVVETMSSAGIKE